MVGRAEWTDSPTKTPTAPIEGGRREALAYHSGVLDLEGDLRVPRAYEIVLDDDGHVALWLEDVRPTGPDRWRSTCTPRRHMPLAGSTAPTSSDRSPLIPGW